MLPPGPRSLVPGRRIREFGRDRLAYLEHLASFGDVSWFRDLGLSFALVNHPDHARDVLVTRARSFHKGIALQRSRILFGEGLLTSEGEHHLRQRRLMQPAFHRERIAAFGALMGSYAEAHCGRWRAGEAHDVSHEMMALTLAIAGKALFDADVQGDTRTIGEAVDEALDAFQLVLLPGGPLIARLPIPPMRRFKRALAALDSVVYRLIRERRTELAAGERDHGDVLTMLLEAVDPDAAGDEPRTMTDLQVRDEAITLLLAGHETTANALAWTWWFLAQHREVERALHAEVDAVLSADGGAPRAATAEDLARLPFTRMVVAESMRLRPPAYVLGRLALEDYPVAGTPYVIPRGTTVFVAQHLLHRDPRFWPDPLRFAPERWRGDQPGSRTRFTYLPFGAGTRICIGEQFAWMELVLVLATIARRWRLVPAPGALAEPEPLITLRIRGGLRMVVESREPRRG